MNKYTRRSPVLPNATLVLSMEEVEFIKANFQFDVLEDKYGKKLVDDIFKKMLYYSTLAIDFNNAINETLVEQIRYYVSELEKIYDIVRS